MNLINLPDDLKITTLDLSNRKLTNLPDLSKYTNLVKLDISCNDIINLDNIDYFPPNLEILNCSNNELPYKDLAGYKEWYAKTYPERIQANKYNM